MTMLRLLPDLEETLRTLPDVRAVSVVTSPDGAPVEVHVLARAGRPGAQVVRDVQSVALAQHGVELDPGIVNVVQLGDHELGVPVVEDPPAVTRVAISEVTVSTAGPEVTATVRLETYGERFEGTAVGLTSTDGRSRVVAEATLRATETLLGLSTEVEQAAVIDLGTHAVAVCVIQVLAPTEPFVVTGSALVRLDEADAIARAVLDSLNRRLAN